MQRRSVTPKHSGLRGIEPVTGRRLAVRLRDQAKMKIAVAPRHLRIRISRRISGAPLRLARSVRRLVRSVRGKALYPQALAAISAYFGRLSVAVPRLESRTRDRPAKPNPNPNPNPSPSSSAFSAAQGRKRVVPGGFVAVYVGEEQQRFVIPIGHLQHPFMVSLMVKAEDTFGLDHRGPLAFPCDVNEFELLQWLIERENNVQCLV